MNNGKLGIGGMGNNERDGKARLFDGLGTTKLEGFRPDTGSGDAGRTSWPHGDTQDAAQMDSRRRPLVVAQTTPDTPPAMPASRMLSRVNLDRRLRPEIVRRSSRS
jgi:hypothetical protein